VRPANPRKRSLVGEIHDVVDAPLGLVERLLRPIAGLLPLAECSLD